MSARVSLIVHYAHELVRARFTIEMALELPPHADETAMAAMAIVLSWIESGPTRWTVMAEGVLNHSAKCNAEVMQLVNFAYFAHKPIQIWTRGLGPLPDHFAKFKHEDPNSLVQTLGIRITTKDMSHSSVQTT